MPPSGTSWQASDGPSALATALNRTERDVAAILAELRGLERKAAADEVRRENDAAAMTALRDEVGKLRRDVKGLRQVIIEMQAAVAAEERVETKALRAKLLKALGLLGLGGGALELARRLLG